MSLSRPAFRVRHSARAVLLAACMAPGCLQAHAAEPLQPADALVRAALPLSPLLFDLAVTAGRSFAEITYDSRGYDAVTNSFNVSGLRVKRYAVDVSIGRLRTDLRSIMLEGIGVETQGMGLPAPFRAALRRLGGSNVQGDILLGVRADAARSSYDVTLRLDLPQMGALEVAAALDGFHVLVPIPSSDTSSYSPQPSVAGSLRSASVAFENYGLMKVALEMAAQQAGAPAEQFKAGLYLMPQQVAAQLIQRMPGGASPGLTARIRGWAAVAEEFLREEDGIRVSFAPSEPVDLWRLQTGFVDEKLIVDLNPEAAPAFAAPLPAPAEPGSVAAAVAEIAGNGVPQDRAAGAIALLDKALAGDRGAVAALAANFGAAPAPALDGEVQAALYSSLLVARALGERVEDGALAALIGTLEPQAVLGAEMRAISLFQTMGGRQVVTPGQVGKHDADALRAFAYDYYEGRKVPRNYTQALALALVASAAGDSFAARLRDDLVNASERKAILLDAALAQSEADRMWKIYEEARRPAPQP
ncbi:MAG: hypothetical protein KF849_08040 [Rhizobiaceae bacterium]|nr:hypothetical protein [Rhizobiaceae bacterium]